MSPELEEYLAIDDRIGSEIAHLTLNLEEEERNLRRALGSRNNESTWREFIVMLVIAVLLLNSLAIHMGALLGWWDPNELVGIIDQQLTALNTYETDVAPLFYAARAIGWLGVTACTIFFAFPYQFLTLVEELISMVLPIASPYLPYVEGVILGFFALNVLKMCPLAQGTHSGLAGMGNKEASSSRRRISELKREIKAKETERNRLPREKVMAARQAELEERKWRESEERRRQEEAERQRREEERQRQEAERRRKEAERQEERRRNAEFDAMERRVKEAYWDESMGNIASVGPDILILSGDTSQARMLAETLRRFCPDSRMIFELAQIEQAESRLRSGRELSVYLLVSEVLSEEQLYRFYSSDFSLGGIVFLRVKDYSWVNEENECPHLVDHFDQERGKLVYRLTVERIDIGALEMLYVVPGLVPNKWEEGEPFPFRKEVIRRFTRFRTAEEQNRKSWHLEGDTLVIDGVVRSVDGRAPWADERNSFSRVVLREATALASYGELHRSFCQSWRLEGLFEGCSNLVYVDLSKMSTRFNYYEEIAGSFLGCPKLSEVRIPEYWPLVNALDTGGFHQDDDGVWRRQVL